MNWEKVSVADKMRKEVDCTYEVMHAKKTTSNFQRQVAVE